MNRNNLWPARFVSAVAGRLLPLIALLLAACAGQHFDPDSRLGAAATALGLSDEVDESREIELGERAAAHLLGAYPPVEDTRRQRYINLVGRWVAQQSQRPGLPWRFALIDDPAINALAVPGGIVLLSTGLWDLLETEAELAAVLAHEIAHIEQQHHMRALVHQGVWGRLLSHKLEFANRSGERVVITSSGLYKLLATKLTREDELASDLRAHALLHAAGYDSHALSSVLQRMAQVNASDVSRLSYLLSTHPPMSDRLESLQSDAAPEHGGGSQGRDRFLAIAQGRQSFEADATEDSGPDLIPTLLDLYF
ncbi:MAG: M48 family metalloprotease [Pseudomonadota bacterium]|nr:M48 family metalloprotease [Pseudomonadota bacterium]